ncbi:16883_t:CDS:2, partial [Dentiscutata erythropus]
MAQKMTKRFSLSSSINKKAVELLQKYKDDSSENSMLENIGNSSLTPTPTIIFNELRVMIQIGESGKNKFAPVYLARWTRSTINRYVILHELKNKDCYNKLLKENSLEHYYENDMSEADEELQKAN